MYVNFTELIGERYKLFFKLVNVCRSNTHTTHPPSVNNRQDAGGMKLKRIS